MRPVVPPLTRIRRKLVFLTLLAAFLILLPLSIFYAIGYRYDFTQPNPAITVTGAFYVFTDSPQAEIFVNDQRIENARTFRRAFYIQGLPPGVHRVHVQIPGMHTWVKELPITPHLVTEMEAFNVPLVPIVRYIPAYETADGRAVIPATASTTPSFFLASSSLLYTITTSTATRTLAINQEYRLLDELFLEKASTTAVLRAFEGVHHATTSSTSLSVATTTKERDGLRVYEQNGDIIVERLNQGEEPPHYFCHTAQAIEISVEEMDTYGTSTIPSRVPVESSECRTTIRMDRQGKKVHDFDFHPETPNLLLLQLDDGLYVVEIDDRTWQNSQPLYRGTTFEFILYRGGVFIKEGDAIFEVALQRTEG